MRRLVERISSTLLGAERISGPTPLTRFVVIAGRGLTKRTNAVVACGESVVGTFETYRPA